MKRIPSLVLKAELLFRSHQFLFIAYLLLFKYTISILRIIFLAFNTNCAVSAPKEANYITICILRIIFVK